MSFITQILMRSASTQQQQQQQQQQYATAFPTTKPVANPVASQSDSIAKSLASPFEVPASTSLRQQSASLMQRVARAMHDISPPRDMPNKYALWGCK